MRDVLLSDATCSVVTNHLVTKLRSVNVAELKSPRHEMVRDDREKVGVCSWYSYLPNLGFPVLNDKTC